MSDARRTSRFPEEDTSPTTDKELWGWYCYGMAAEVFAVCGVGLSPYFNCKAKGLTIRRLLSARDSGAAGSRKWGATF